MKQINILKCRVKKSPFTLIHLLTSKCNCKCEICNLWKNKEDYKEDLSTKEIFSLLEDARKAGIVNYVAMGGEPLMRQDLPEILKYAKKLKFCTIVITNGFYLKERCHEILPFTDVLEISIDSNDDLHDKMRKVNGILKRSIQGIKTCKNSKTKIIINSVISKANYDKIYDLLELSKNLDVFISFQPIDIVEGYNDSLIPKDKVIQRVFSEIINFKKLGYKVSNSFSYLKVFSNKKNYICHGPKCLVVVKPNGDITSCLNYKFYDKIWGNVKEKSLTDVFSSGSFRKFCKKVEICNECNDACVIESSYAYSLNTRFLIEKIIR